jgi:ERCC4-related helicase
MTQEEQMRVLRDFREGVYNVLVATSIGEEGLDIPEFGLVVFYEPAVSGIRYIQRRGWTGRRLPGKVVILVAEGTVDEYYFREGYRRARKMERILKQASEKTARVLRRAERPQPRYSCSISTPTASRPIRTETTHVEKVPAKGSRTRSPGELTSYISLSIRCRFALAGCLTASLGKNLR